MNQIRVAGLGLAIGMVACSDTGGLVLDRTGTELTLGYVPPSCSAPGGSFACGGREGPLPPGLPACVEDRWVGYQLAAVGPCPRPRKGFGGRWAVSKPFAGLSAAAPTELQRFCVYEWRSSAGVGPKPWLLPNLPDLRLERDCEAVSPQMVPGASQATLQASWVEQLGLPEYAPGTGLPVSGGVTVAVVDTAPSELASGLPSEGADGHGHAVGALVRAASCLRSGGQELDCAARVESYQALGLGDELASFGRPIDVGVSMAEALDRWVGRGSAEPLILNLSVGWDGRYGGRHGPSIRMTALAPWLVAQWAGCEGALVVASAGNRSQVGAASGPLFPAGWEQDPRLCPGSPVVYGPLVHAAGAVDGRDVGIRVARPNGTPRLLVPGGHVSVLAPRPDATQQAGKLMAGTSVSAAGLSGVAALVWGLSPSLSADEVIQTIYRSAVPNGAFSEFGLSGNWGQARIDACTAAAQVCAPAAVPCPLACTVRAPGVDARPDFAAVLDAELPGLRAGPATQGASVGPAPLVPIVDEHLLEPRAGPQPGGTVCPLCGVYDQFLLGKLELPPDAKFKSAYLRPTPCDPMWCDPELSGVQVELVDPQAEFKVDLSGQLDPFVIESALIEVVTETDGKEVVRSSEVFIGN